MTATTTRPDTSWYATWSGDQGDYVRNYYRVPAFAGGRIRFRGKPGLIVDFDAPYLLAIIEGYSEHPVPLHPTWEVEYVPRVQVQSWRRPGGRKPDDVANVARPTQWGNPFEVDILRANDPTLTEDTARRLAVDSFATWLQGDDPGVSTLHIGPTRRRWMLRHLDDLRGMRLACYCKPTQHCHADHLTLLAATV